MERIEVYMNQKEAKITPNILWRHLRMTFTLTFSFKETIL